MLRSWPSRTASFVRSPTSSNQRRSTEWTTRHWPDSHPRPSRFAKSALPLKEISVFWRRVLSSASGTGRGRPSVSSRKGKLVCSSGIDSDRETAPKLTRREKEDADTTSRPSTAAPPATSETSAARNLTPSTPGQDHRRGGSSTNSTSSPAGSDTSISTQTPIRPGSQSDTPITIPPRSPVVPPSPSEAAGERTRGKKVSRSESILPSTRAGESSGSDSGKLQLPRTRLDTLFTG